LPELPEVETVVRSLAPHLPGQRIRNAEFQRVRLLRNDPDEAAAALRGRRIRSIERRGKFIVMTLDPPGYFIVHLGMTGKLLWNGDVGKHTHAVLTFDRGTLVYTDPRKFGRLHYSEALPPALEELGPEPLLISQEQFIADIKKRGARLKALLLDQTFLRGLGNIYADEALFRAGIHPLAVSRRLTRARLAGLHAAIQQVLAEAIAGKGSSIADYVDSDGQRGSFQHQHRVYRRTGEPCVQCGATIRRTLVTQRGTHYCPHCQKR